MSKQKDIAELNAGIPHAQKRAHLEANTSKTHVPPIQSEINAPLLLIAASSSNGAAVERKPLTIRNIAEILEYVLEDNDLILSNGYLCKRMPATWLGQGGLGKSRLSIQLACCCVLGHDFLGIPTRGKGQRWLFLQTENGMRRLKYDLERMRLAHSADDWEFIMEHIFFHTLESDEDGIILLNDIGHFARAEEAIIRINADVIVIDPLRDCHGGELNSDQEMTSATRNLARLSKVGGRTDRALLVLHHAITGKAGASKATGWDRSSFGRNSKVLHGWTRAQMNIAPGSADNSDVLVVASGKNNDFREFDRFAIELDPRTMTYRVKEDFDFDAWQTEITGAKKSTKSLGEDQILQLLRAVGGRMEKKELIQAAVSRYGRGEKHTRTVITRMAEEGNFVVEQKQKRPGKPDAVYVELCAHADQNVDNHV